VTQPDELFPPGAVNFQPPGFAAWSARTEADWRAIMGPHKPDLSKLAFDNLVACWTSFKTEWSAINWSTWGTTPSFHAAFEAARHLARCVWQWFLEVIHNVTGPAVDLTQIGAAFCLDDLHTCNTTFLGAWNAISWTLWDTAPNFRAAVSAVTQYVRCLSRWATTVATNLTPDGVDLSKTLDAFAPDEIHGVWTTFTTAWDASTGYRTAFTAFGHLIAGTWRWALHVINNITNVDALSSMAAFELPTIRGIWSDFRAAWAAIDFEDWPHVAANLRAAWRAGLALVRGTLAWARQVVENLTDIDLSQTLFAPLALGQLRGVWSTFDTAWTAIDWSNPTALPANIVAGFIAVGHLVAGIIKWALTAVLNISNVDLTLTFDAWDLPGIRGVWADFTVAWDGIDWTNLAVLGANLVAGFAALGALLQGIVTWGLNVFQAMTGRDLRQALAGLALGTLRTVLSDFKTTWTGINFTTATGLWTAFCAVLDLAGGIAGWMVTVIKNIWGSLDLAGLKGAFGIGTLRGHFNTWETAVAGLSFTGGGGHLAPAGVITFITATFALFRGIGNWLLGLITSFLGLNTTAIHAAFSDWNTFADLIIQFFFGDLAVTAWHNALDLLGGVGSTLVNAITAVYNRWANLISLLPDKLTGIPGAVISDVENWATGLSTSISNMVTNAAAAVTAFFSQLLVGLGLASMADLGAMLADIKDKAETAWDNLNYLVTHTPAENWSGFVDWLNARTGHIDDSGQYDAAYITGTIGSGLLYAGLPVTDYLDKADSAYSTANSAFSTANDAMASVNSWITAGLNTTMIAAVNTSDLSTLHGWIANPSSAPWVVA
jgi:hypothetical protein